MIVRIVRFTNLSMTAFDVIGKPAEDFEQEPLKEAPQAVLPILKHVFIGCFNSIPDALPKHMEVAKFAMEMYVSVHAQFTEAVENNQI